MPRETLTRAIPPAGSAATIVRGLGIFSVALSFLLPNVAAGQAAQGFTFCARPYPPPCALARDGTVAGGDCDEEMKAYLDVVLHYRECLGIEGKRVMREANDFIDAWKCKKTGAGCPNN